jgi:hypothetical protein
MFPGKVGLSVKVNRLLTEAKGIEETTVGLLGCCVMCHFDVSNYNILLYISLQTCIVCLETKFVKVH